MTDSCTLNCLIEMARYGPPSAAPRRVSDGIFWCGYGGINITPTIRHGQTSRPYHAITAWLELDERCLKLAVKRADHITLSSIDMDRFEQEWLKRMGDRPIPTGTGQSKDAVNVFWETVLLFLRA